MSKYKNFMIDLLKILTFDTGFATKLFNNPLLKDYSLIQSFKNNLNKEAPEIQQAKFIKEYREILFFFYFQGGNMSKLEILIKPHYYFNNNLHNANDFSVSECIRVLTEIKDIFSLPIQELSILNIEYGVNGISPIDIKDLMSFTIYHDKNEFINSSDDLRFSKISYKYNENGRANNYKKIKFYAKGIQFPQFCNLNTFRFELKSKRRNFIKNRLQIFTYEDLLNVDTYDRLSNSIKTEFTNLLILDVDNEGKNLTSNERKKLYRYNNPIFWNKVMGLSKNTFNNNKKLYYELLDKTGFNLHKKVAETINTKLNYLLKDCAILTPPNELKDCANLNVYIIENGTINKKRLCPITGLDLIHENISAKYARTSTFKNLRENNIMKYIEVCSLLLSNTNGDHPKYEADIITHLCKQVRNRFYNLSIIKRTGYNKKKYENQMELII